MMTSKERAEFRAQANTLDVTLIVGKGGISDTLLDEAVVLLDSHELVKGRVLETSGLTAREASDAICEALGAEGIACVGTKFVIWRKSEKVEQEKKKAASTTANLLNNRSKDNKSSRIIQQVRSIFLSGRKVTAKEINAETNSNDARRVISTLRNDEGWDIKDVRLDDRRKLYWLEPDKRQMSIDWEGGTK